MEDNAMGLYPISRETEKRLYGFRFKEVRPVEQLKGVAFVFNNTYRKLNIDIVIDELGHIFITDTYGETMKRDKMEYVILPRNFYKRW